MWVADKTGHWVNQGSFGNLFSEIGALQKSGFPMCMLLIKQATYWLGATRGLWEAFCRDLDCFLQQCGSVLRQVVFFIVAVCTYMLGQIW